MSANELRIKPGFPIAIVAFLLLLILLAYANTLHSPFNFDDESVIRNDIAQGGSIFWNFYPIRYRHLFYLSLSLNYSTGQLNPFGYHLFNIATHFLTTTTVLLITYLTILYGLRREKNAALAIAGITALFYGLNPVHTEAVTYISGRASSLSALFYFLSLLFFLAGSLKITLFRFHRPVFYLLALLTFSLSVLGKETAVTLPLIVLLYEFCFMRNDQWGPFKERLFYVYLPLPLLGALGLLVSPDLGSIIADWAEKIDYSYALAQASIIVYAVRLFFLPTGQTFDYDFPPGFFPPDTILLLPALILCVIVITMLFYSQQIPKVVFFSVFWFLLTLAPTNSILPRTDWLSERNLYLPSYGLSLLFGAGAYHFFLSAGSTLYRRVGAVCVLIILTFHCALLIQRNATYRSNILLWEDTLNKSPGNIQALHNLSHFYIEGKSYQKAFIALNKLTNSNASPYYLSYAHSNLGTLYGKWGEKEKAEREFKEGIRLSPTQPSNYINLGSFYAEQGNLERALAEYEKAEKLYKDYQWGHSPPAELFIDKARVHNRLGIAYLESQNSEGALREFEQAVSTHPEMAEAHFNLGKLLLELRRNPSRAREHLKTALRLSPNPEHTQIIQGMLNASANSSRQADLP